MAVRRNLAACGYEKQVDAPLMEYLTAANQPAEAKQRAFHHLCRFFSISI
jgi:hypothetical protein